MKRSNFAALKTIALAAALGATNLHASRLQKVEPVAFHEGHGTVCIGCRIYVESTRGRPFRLDRGPHIAVSNL